MRYALAIGTALFLFGAPSPSARGDVTVSIRDGSGSLTIDRLQEVNGEWEVEITAWGDGLDPVVIGVEGEDGDVIRYVHVVSIEKNPGDHVRLIVWAPTSSQNVLERVREVKRVPNTGPDPDAWLRILLIEAEHVGDESNSPSGLVEARTIDRVEATGDITATITTEGEFTDILEVIAGGDVLGDVFTEQKVIGGVGTIGRVEAGGQIGTVADPILINAWQGSIGNVKGGAVHADIKAPFVRRVEAVSGDFSGAIVADTFGGSGTGDPGLYVFGDVDGEVRLTGNLPAQAAIEVGGSLIEGNTISIGIDLLGDIAIGAGGLEG